jgi:dihydrofolate reductase
MSDVVVFMSLTLDGIMQAPGRADEDRRGGFEHGGWATPYADEATGRMAAEGMADTGALVLGRRTYEDILPFWNKTGGPFKDMLNNTPKYVASKTLHEPLAWPNSELLDGDAVEAVSGLREQPGKDLVILGSGDLVRSLMRHDLVDRYVLLIHPLVLGHGQRLFADGVPMAALRLDGSKTTTMGVTMATYRTAEPAT